MKKINHLVEILTEKYANSLQHTPVQTYIAEYCYYSVCKTLQCETCKTKITSQVGDLQSIKNALIFRIIRGGFLYPLSDVVYIATDNYIIVNKLKKKLISLSLHLLKVSLLYILQCLLWMKKTFSFFIKKPVKIITNL